MFCVFLDGVPDFEIRDEIVYITATENGEPRRVCTKLRDFRLGLIRAGKLLLEYDGAGRVIPMRPHHAAS